MTDDYLQVTTTTDSRREAAMLARSAVEGRLAACAQLVGPIASTYWWEDEVESAEEWMVLFKTTSARLEELASLITEQHSYDTPEIIATPVTAGGADYLDWVSEQTDPDRRVGDGDNGTETPGEGRGGKADAGAVGLVAADDLDEDDLDEDDLDEDDLDEDEDDDDLDDDDLDDDLDDDADDEDDEDLDIDDLDIDDLDEGDLRGDDPRDDLDDEELDGEGRVGGMRGGQSVPTIQRLAEPHGGPPDG